MQCEELRSITGCWYCCLLVLLLLVLLLMVLLLLQLVVVVRDSRIRLVSLS